MTVRPLKGAARPTMKDVAARAGVGLKTVSRVVNDEPGVSADIRRRVRRAIDDLGFRRNDSARMLRRGQTASIGLVIEDVAEPFQSVLTRAVEEVTYGRGSLLFTASSTGSAVRERSVVLAFCARRVDGLIVIPEPHSHGYLHPELDAGIRAVFIDRPPQDIDTDVVLADNAGGARAGVDHLLRHGHRRIGYLGDRPELFTATERLRGFREGLEAAGVPFDDALVCMAAPDRDRIAETLARMLAGPDPATAVMTGNSLLSLGVLRALGDAPRRPALLGFDDFELADIISPGLTVVAQDPASMGRTAADLLFRRLAGEDGPPQTIQLRTTLIPRGSAEAAPASP